MSDNAVAEVSAAVGRSGQRRRLDYLVKRTAAALGIFLPSFLTRPLFRLVGHRIGRNTRLPMFSYVFANRLELGNDVDIRPFTLISVSEVSIGSNTIVSFGAQIIGAKRFQTGDNCFIGPHCIIHCDENVSLGFYSGVGPRCTIYTHGSFLPVTMGYPAAFAEVRLDDFVWTAMAVLFLPGAHVERNCIINPGVVVRGRIPADTRIETAETSFTRLNQTRLLRYAQRTPSHYHQAMVRGFLTAENLKWSENADASAFRCDDGFEFRSLPETNQLELWKQQHKIAAYDLEHFYTADSSNRVHRRFIRFLRRRFGLTLRVNYAE